MRLPALGGRIRDMPAVVRVERLTKSYGSARGVVEMTFDVPGGEVFGFLGPNGV